MRLRNYRAGLRQELGSHDSYYDEQDLQQAAVTLGTLAREGKAAATLDLVTKAGTKIPFEYAVTNVCGRRDDEVLVISVGRDVTERNKADRKSVV